MVSRMPVHLSLRLPIPRRRRNKNIPMPHALSWLDLPQRLQPLIRIPALEHMCLLHQPVHQLAMALFERFLDKPHHHDVALHLDVLADVQALPRRANAELRGRLGFTGQRAADAPFRADVEAEGRIDVRLQAVGEVVEAGVIGDGAGCEAAGEVGYFIYTIR